MTAPTLDRTRLRRLAAIGGGLLGVAALAGCSPAASSGTAASDAGTAPSSASAPAASSGSSASSSALKDGTYTATGDYQSPGGPSAVGVEVTLKSGTITAVKVEPKAADPTAQQYERQFASGISGVAVGKPIEGLQVGAVSGSSLTSQGFEKALATIRSEAAA
jgi:uncharacterized protein with FMN-binding domain